MPVLMQEVNFLSSYWENILKDEPVNKVDGGWLCVRSLIVIEVVVFGEEALHEVDVVSIVSDVDDEFGYRMRLLLLEEHADHSVMRGVVVARVDLPRLSHVNNLHLHVRALPLDLMLARPIEVHFLSLILNETITILGVRCVHIDVP